MCKIMVITNIKDSTRDKALDFIKEMAPKLSVNNNDGLGYAALDDSGNLFAERWFKNSNAFKKPVSSPFKNLVSFDNIEYNSEGNVNLDKVTAMTLHTRMATCEKSLKNTHPFIKDGTSVIHNGVIRNPEVYKPMMSTCDSESLLNGYLSFDLANNPKSLETMVNPLQGYWAVAAFSKVQDSYVLDIFKHNANLYAVFVDDLETWVFSTNSNDITMVCDKLGFTYSSAGSVENNSHIRLNPISGEVILLDTYIKNDVVVQPRNSWTDYDYDTSYYTKKYSKEISKGYSTDACLTYSEHTKHKEVTKPKVTVLTGKEFTEQVMGIKTK